MKINYIITPKEGDELGKFMFYGFLILVLVSVFLWIGLSFSENDVSKSSQQEKCVRYKYGIVTNVYRTGGRSKKTHVEVEYGNEKLEYTDSKRKYKIGDEYCRCTQWK